MKKLSLSITPPMLIALTITIFGLAPPAFGQLDITWFTVDGGGHTFSTGGAFRLGGTCGQFDAGSLTGSDFTLSGGFWLRGNTLSAVPEEPNGPDTAEDSGLPLELRITAGLMNPFRHETGIRLELPATLPVEVRVYDISGRLVRQLYNGHLPPGTHHLAWNGKNNGGQRVASSVYLLHIRAGIQVVKKPVVLLR
jgi:hypothetical protein